MILEGIVTTLSLEGALNVAPMGPWIDPDLSMARFVLRPFHTSTTYQNLKSRGEGVFHVTDDVLLVAQTAIGAAPFPGPATRAADVIVGQESSSTPADTMNFGLLSSMTAMSGPRLSSRQSLRDDFASFFRVQPSQARRGRGGHHGDSSGLASHGRGARRISQAVCSGRQDRRPARAGGLHPLAPACT